jgi:hypothetical protein
VRPYDVGANAVQDDYEQTGPTDIRTVDQALAWLAEQSRLGTDFGIGWCLRVQRTAWGVPPKYTTAWESGSHAGDLSATAPPRGSIGYFSGGSGHVVTCIGDGTCWTTDFLRDGRIDRVAIDDIRRWWSNLTWRGWSHIINDVVVLRDDEQHEQEDDEEETDDDMTPEQAAALDRIDRALAEAVGPGQRNFAGTVAATLAVAQTVYNAVTAPPGLYRIKAPDQDAQYLVAGGVRMWIKNQEYLGQLRADSLPLEVIDDDDTRWLFPLVGPDAPK